MLNLMDRLPPFSAKKKPCGCGGKTAARAGADVVVDARDTIQIVIGVGVAGIGIVSAKPRRLTQINDTVMRYLE